MKTSLTLVLGCALAAGCGGTHGKMRADTPVLAYQKPDISEITGIDEDESSSEEKTEPTLTPGAKAETAPAAKPPAPAAKAEAAPAAKSPAPPPAAKAAAPAPKTPAPAPAPAPKK